MKSIVIVLVGCALIGQIESQATTTTGNRPNFIQSFFAPLGQFLAIFRRPSGVQALASAQQSGGQDDDDDATASAIVTDPQQVQDNLNGLQPAAAEPVVETQFVTEVVTVFSTIPSLERVTSVEMTTQTVFETVKMTQFKTEHVTVTHTTAATPPPASKAPSSSVASSSSSRGVEKSAVTPSAVSTSAVVQPTKKARLAPYVVKRAVEIEASSL